jgi:hypothetical protein
MIGAGLIVLMSPTTAKIDLPADVAEEIRSDLKPKTETLWQLGDAPLEQDG